MRRSRRSVGRSVRRPAGWPLGRSGWSRWVGRSVSVGPSGRRSARRSAGGAIRACRKELHVMTRVAMKRVLRIVLFANGGGCAPPNPPFLKSVHACRANTMSLLCSQQKEGYADHSNGPVHAPRNPARSIHAGLTEHHVITMFAMKGGLFRSCCLQTGGCAPPTSQAVFKPSVLAVFKTSFFFFAMRKAMRIFLFANGVGGLPPTPSLVFLKALMLTVQNIRSMLCLQRRRLCGPFRVQMDWLAPRNHPP